MLREVDERFSARLTGEFLNHLVSLIPDAWLDDPAFSGPPVQRAAYVEYLRKRLQPPRAFVDEAIDAHAQLV
jgi:hypothetical protein